MAQLKFKGVHLVKIIKATTTPNHGGDGPETYVYECEFHTTNGMHIPSMHVSLNRFQRDWGKDIGMTKTRFAKLQGGTVTPLTEPEYDQAIIDWNAA